MSQIDGAVAEEVRVMIARKRVTQKRLAATVGLTPMALSRRLAGDVPISAAELVKIAGALGCRPEELLPHLDSNQEPFGYWFRSALGLSRASLERGTCVSRTNADKSCSIPPYGTGAHRGQERRTGRGLARLLQGCGSGKGHDQGAPLPSDAVVVARRPAHHVHS